MSGPVVISLEGDLGAGKTTFTQGFAEGLGIKEKIQSPTFVILKVYAISHTPYAISHKKQNVRHKAYGVQQLIHVDAYRLQAKDFKVLGWKEFIKNPQNIILVEWGNKIKSILPKNATRILFEHRKNPKERKIRILNGRRDDWERIVDFGSDGVPAKELLRYLQKK